MLIVIYR